MASERIPQVNQLIKKELGQIILREVDLPEGVLVTLTRVETLPNLIESKVYISVLPDEKTAEILGTLKKIVYSLQQKLNKRLKMRPIPKIMFVEEIATKEAGRVEELLEEIRDKKSKFKNQNLK
ncbi:MAG: 30S ribosome-binding factor RbfA [Candidatus Nealsonbacteria bacterium]|nr:30S ribosome-binding factor RbfA [Candidatus Nealsonbacteria bacterium]